METKYPKVSDVMPRDRFLKLLTPIHFEDNLNVSEDARKDKLCKLRPGVVQDKEKAKSSVADHYPLQKPKQNTTASEKTDL
ncbi:hypothetical protein CRUP_028194 [Coryphaenoides rupestris]|nr:hypothetical protein CRUP_028194 [Coryphaenoides rupestris]